MKNLGMKRIYFTGSQKVHDRVVKKNEDNGTYWARWYGQDIQVRQIDGYDRVVSGWRTVEKY